MKLKICPFSLYQNLALVNPRLSISYPDSIKLPYFADFTQRGDRGGEKRPKDRVKDMMTLKENSIVCYKSG
jgi:hypothetical protein